MLRAVKLQFIFVFIIIAISPCPTYLLKYAYSKLKRVINVQSSEGYMRKITCVTNDII
jgi:hypothetical protein